MRKTAVESSPPLPKNASSVVKKPSTRQVDAARQRIAKLRARLGEIELLCSGSLSERMMKCGKPNCRCATDPRLVKKLLRAWEADSERLIDAAHPAKP